MEGLRLGIQAASDNRREKIETQRNVFQILAQEQGAMARQRAQAAALMAQTRLENEAEMEQEEYSQYFQSVRKQMDNEAAMEREMFQARKDFGLEEMRQEGQDRRLTVQETGENQRALMQETGRQARHADDMEYKYTAESNKFKIAYAQQRWKERDAQRKYLQENYNGPADVETIMSWYDAKEAGAISGDSYVALLKKVGITPKQARELRKLEIDESRLGIDQANLELTAKRDTRNAIKQQHDMQYDAMQFDLSEYRTNAEVYKAMEAASAEFVEKLDAELPAMLVAKGQMKEKDAIAATGRLKNALTEFDALQKMYANGQIKSLDELRQEQIRVYQRNGIDSSLRPIASQYLQLRAIANHSNAEMLRKASTVMTRDGQMLVTPKLFESLELPDYTTPPPPAKEHKSFFGDFMGDVTGVGPALRGMYHNPVEQLTKGVSTAASPATVGIGTVAQFLAPFFGPEAEEYTRMANNPVGAFFVSKGMLTPAQRDSVRLIVREAKPQATPEEIDNETEQILNLNGFARQGFITDQAAKGNQAARAMIDDLHSNLSATREQTQYAVSSVALAPIGYLAGKGVGAVAKMTGADKAAMRGLAKAIDNPWIARNLPTISRATQKKFYRGIREARKPAYSSPEATAPAQANAYSSPIGPGGQQYSSPIGPGGQQYSSPIGPGGQQYTSPAGPFPQQHSAPAGPFPQQYSSPAGPFPQQYDLPIGPYGPQYPAAAGPGGQLALPARASTRPGLVLQADEAYVPGSYNVGPGVLLPEQAPPGAIPMPGYTGPGQLVPELPRPAVQQGTLPGGVLPARQPSVVAQPLDRPTLQDVHEMVAYSKTAPQTLSQAAAQAPDPETAAVLQQVAQMSEKELLWRQAAAFQPGVRPAADPVGYAARLTQIPKPLYEAGKAFTRKSGKQVRIIEAYQDAKGVWQVKLEGQTRFYRADKL